MKRRNWEQIIDRFYNSRSKLRHSYIKMGSPGSAQVTRCRLLEQWNGIKVRTSGPWLVLEK